MDGEWRFSPEDPSIPDANGNINNFIDTTGFRPMIDGSKKYTLYNLVSHKLQINKSQLIKKIIFKE